MGLLDIGIGLAEKYGPQLLQGIGNLNRGGGSPMMGFAAPASGQPSLGSGGGRGGYLHPHRGYTSAGAQHWHSGRKKGRRGLTASDIRGAQKVARLVQAFGFRPKIKARRRGRR